MQTVLHLPRLFSKNLTSYSKKEDWLSYYRQKSIVLGKRITVTTYNECYKAKAKTISDNGYLIIEKDNGDKTTLISGEVSITGDF